MLLKLHAKRLLFDENRLKTPYVRIVRFLNFTNIIVSIIENTTFCYPKAPSKARSQARAQARVGTDDAQLVEDLGVEVHVVESLDPNPKITTPADLAWAERWLAEKEA